MNTETIDPLDATRAQRTNFDPQVIFAGNGLTVSGPAEIIGANGNKKLFCRLPLPLQVALQACLTCDEQSRAG